MTPEQLTHCTEPFYTSKSDGSGLGLSECHGIVRQHGGHLQVTSALGNGTTVRIELPGKKTREPRLEQPFVTADAQNQKTQTGSAVEEVEPARIL